MQKAQNERIEAFDILRAFAIGAVILIHTVSGSLYNISWSSLSFKIYIAIDQFSRFSVPLFVFLSGYTLSLRYGGGFVKISEYF